MSPKLPDRMTASTERPEIASTLAELIVPVALIPGGGAGAPPPPPPPQPLTTSASSALPRDAEYLFMIFSQVGRQRQATPVQFYLS
jgi:hypothetical protein